MNPQDDEEEGHLLRLKAEELIPGSLGNKATVTTEFMSLAHAALFMGLMEEITGLRNEVQALKSASQKSSRKGKANDAT